MMRKIHVRSIDDIRRTEFLSDFKQLLHVIAQERKAGMKIMHNEKVIFSLFGDAEDSAGSITRNLLSC